MKGGAIFNAEPDKDEARAAPIASGMQALRVQFTRTLSYMKQAASAQLSVHGELVITVARHPHGTTLKLRHWEQKVGTTGLVVRIDMRGCFQLTKQPSRGESPSRKMLAQNCG